MSLKAIDVSNWQKGLDVSKLTADIIIAKATEGTSFIDKYCNGFIQTALDSGKLIGYYHFAKNNNPEAEAQFFWNNTRGYNRKGVPILDIEDTSIKNWQNYCERFATEYHRLSGVHPMIYVSAGHLSKFTKSWLQDKCALWVAGYPKPYRSWIRTACPYKIAPWSLLTGWQFTSSFKYGNMNLDASLFYLEPEAWMKIAGAGEPRHTQEDTTASESPNSPAPALTAADVVRDVIAGKYGNGQARVDALRKAGYDPVLVQAEVNKALGVTVKTQRVHTVRRGETLSRIASLYGTTWQALAKKNNIANPNLIYVGQKIVI